jgi:Adenylate and Guanylate cyclase catalytic domain
MTNRYLLHFPDILPNDSNGIQVVFTNPCTDAFTYQINGESAVYQGVGDGHDHKFNHLAKHRRLIELHGTRKKGSTYSGARLNDAYCPMSLHLYPSEVMRSQYTTNRPIIFTFATIAIFAFTSLVFCLYDKKVESRQKTVLTTATHSTAIVSSLFPSAVRDQLYPLSASTEGDSPEGGIATNHNFDGKGEQSKGRPIAELYPDTTVMFADIAGFTAWSSERQPTQVFHLLETLYAAFDEIAKRRGVFKVETIGDCYVAVVGLPTPRKHHAVVMARFAQDCIERMCELTRELEKVLGPVSTERTCSWWCKCRTSSTHP